MHGSCRYIVKNVCTECLPGNEFTEDRKDQVVCLRNRVKAFLPCLSVFFRTCLPSRESHFEDTKGTCIFAFPCGRPVSLKGISFRAFPEPAKKRIKKKFLLTGTVFLADTDDSSCMYTSLRRKKSRTSGFFEKKMVGDCDEKMKKFSDTIGNTEEIKIEKNFSQREKCFQLLRVLSSILQEVKTLRPGSACFTRYDAAYAQRRDRFSAPHSRRSMSQFLS